MNVWLIQIGETLPIDPKIRRLRTTLLAEKLLERGHTVLWWASAFDHLQKQWVFNKETELELKEGLRIKALKGIEYTKNVSLKRFIDHRIIAKRFKRLASRMPKPDVVIASMPSHDLAYEAVTFAKNNNVPVLVDIRDPWPDIFINCIPSYLQKLAKIILHKDFQMVKKTMQNADGLLSMMNTLLIWGLGYAGRERTWKDRVFYLGYKRIMQSDGKSNRISELLNNLNNKFIVTFIGTFASYHNPSILLDCAKRFVNSNICFILAGDGELFPVIKDKASFLNNVVLPGWLNQDEITSLLQHSHLGVCPTSQVADFFPNKSFSYLSEGLPIISAFQGDLRDIIEKHQIGFYYSPNDVDGLTNCIKKLYDDRNLYKKMSENTHTVFNEICDADKIYDEYARHIEIVADDYNQTK
ncbi:MAG: Glycosyltransferase [Candidatus Jettenia ecosi]|uniref:Glycosyltransferase n=1 Tax=Candidatus Jettenia ecosi TaxID=2494326 RepID=A0A533Q8J4_9BACT|nr:MAG: Glycosyltransferase [Candidatus Jettenia ecosi]